ncbi:hypothetical protein GJ633_05375 [Halorubrum sp. CBA1125]|nr:hypothetical protein [Halorubrum sp. CBA1125]MUW14151.1 hypothetical protein [Halorubrum sp. CBA1125]
MQAQLAEILPDEADTTNPLDIIGDAEMDRFRQSLNIVLRADEDGGAVVLSVPTALFEFEDLVDIIGDLQQKHEKPVVTCLMGGEETDRAADRLKAYGILNYFDPARAVPSLQAFADYRNVTEREYEQPTAFEVEEDRAQEVLSEAVEPGWITSTSRLWISSMPTVSPLQWADLPRVLQRPKRLPEISVALLS